MIEIVRPDWFIIHLFVFVTIFDFRIAPAKHIKEMPRQAPMLQGGYTCWVGHCCAHGYVPPEACEVVWAFRGSRPRCSFALAWDLGSFLLVLRRAQGCSWLLALRVGAVVQLRRWIRRRFACDALRCFRSGVRWVQHKCMCGICTCASCRVRRTTNHDSGERPPGDMCTCIFHLCECRRMS